MQEYLTLLRSNANYRNLWLGSVITQLGDWFNLIASAEVITQLTSSGVAVSYLFLSRFIPLFLFSPLAGVLADRFNRRNIMIFSDVLRAGTVLCFLFVRSPEQVWLFYVLTTLQFTLSALFTPARTAVLANVVAREELVVANALDSLTWSTMLALGSFLGGVVAAIFGANTAFVADAFTFLLSAWFIGRIVMPAQTEEERTAVSRGGWLNFLDGFRYLWREPFILGIALVKAGGSLVWGAINVLEISYANDVFPLNAPALTETLRLQDNGTATLGIIYVVSGLGTGLGPVFMRRWLGDRPTRLMVGITLGFFLMSTGITGIALAPTLSLLLLASAVRTVGSGTVWVFSAAFLQMLVPDRYRGRVFAFEFALLTLTQSISVYAAGFMQDALGFGPRMATAVMAALGFVVSTVWLVFYAAQRDSVGKREASASTALQSVEPLPPG